MGCFCSTDKEEQRELEEREQTVQQQRGLQLTRLRYMGSNLSNLPAPVKQPLHKLPSNDKFRSKYGVYKVTWTLKEHEFSNHIRLIHMTWKILKKQANEINEAILNFIENGEQGDINDEEFRIYYRYDNWTFNDLKIISRYMEIILIKLYNLTPKLWVKQDEDPYFCLTTKDNYYQKIETLDLFIIKDVNMTFSNYKKHVMSLKFLASREILYSLKRKYERQHITSEILQKELEHVPGDIVEYINNNLLY